MESQKYPLRVLVLDDSSSQFTLINDFLHASHTEFQVEWARTVEEGKEIIKTVRFDIGLIDYELGGKNGLDFIREAVADGYETPMILLTGHGGRDVAMQAMQAGAVDYIDRMAFKPDTLERIIRYSIERSRNLREIRSRETLLRQVLETVMVGVFICQEDLIVFTNPRVSELTGYSVDELLTMSFSDLVHPDMREDTQAKMPHVSELETLLVTKGGDELWVNLNLSAIDYQNQTSQLGAFVNITRNKQMQAALLNSEKRFRSLVENSYDLTVLLSRGGHFKYISPSVKTILGYDETAVINQHYSVYFHTEDIPYIQAAFEGMITDPLFRPVVRCRARHANGSWIWLEAVGANLLNDPSVGALIVNAHDISDITQALVGEQQQRALAQALLDTANALNSSLSFDEMLDRILVNVGGVIPHDWANIMLVENGLTRVVGCRGYTPDAETTLLSTRFTAAEMPTFDYMLQHKQAVIVPDVTAASDWVRESEYGVRSYAGAPIIVEDEVIGFINLDSAKAHFFLPEHAERLKVFANQVGIAIKDARAFEQAKTLAAVEERQRLARDLHDAVSQTLFSASVISETLPLIMDNDLNEAKGGLEQLAKLTKGALAEMRTLLVELRPAALLDTELGVLLTLLVNSVRTRTEADIALKIGGDEISLQPDVKVTLYRVAQEALNNVVKYARASEIQVNLEWGTQGVRLCVQDNGRGFDVNNIGPGHFGLQIMQERATNANLSVEVTSAVGQGTSIEAVWLKEGSYE